MNRFRAQKHGLGLPARMQQAIRKKMTAFWIGAELNFINRQEINQPGHGHRFDRAQKIARCRRYDLFFAGDERDMAWPDQAYHPVIILTSQQSQRKAHHAGSVTQHAFNREIGLPGIGRAQNSRNFRRIYRRGHE